MRTLKYKVLRTNNNISANRRLNNNKIDIHVIRHILIIYGLAHILYISQ